MVGNGEIIKCELGHSYYPSISAQCPVCAKNNKKAKPAVTEGPARMAKRSYEALDDNRDEDDEITQVGAKLEMGFLPIAGWLVCIEGAQRGKDYKIHMENNYIGRAPEMDIRIQGDDTISRKNHATISFDRRTGKFFYTPGMGRSIDYVNDNAIFGTIELKARDIIEIGRSKLMFMPLCGSKFNWEDYNENSEESN